MTEPTQQQIAAAERLGISLDFVQTPITVARLVELIEELQKRIEVLELKKWPLRK